MDQHRTNELLLYCLRMDSDETRTARLEELSSSDWKAIIQESARHGVTLLLYHRLKTFHPGIYIPTDVVQRLRQSYLQSASRNLRLYHELGKVLEILRHENIPVIALKGAHLAELVYGNIALRPMGDVDLLVHKDDLIRVEAALLRIGLTPLDRNRVIGKDNRHFGYVQPNRGLHVEIHWNILASMYPFNIDIDGQWERSRPVLIAGAEVSVLCPEDLLLHLCLHNSEHTFEMGIRSICDISEAICHYSEEIGWKNLLLRARQWSIEKCVYLTLKLARELLGAFVPDDLLETIKPNDFDEHFMAIAMKQIFPNGIGTSHGLPLSSNISQLWGSKRLLDKMKILFKTTFQSPEVMTLTYPPPPNSLRIYFYYPVRIIDLFKRYGPTVLRLLRHDQDILVRTSRRNEVTALKDWLMSA
jgi:hypothetical protein